MPEDLISTDANFFSIYIHSGITSTITTSFSSPWTIGMGPQELTFDGGVPTRRYGNLISADESAESVFIHVGVTSTITTSFSMPDLADWGPIAITVDASGNLISARAEGFKTIRIHAGITNTVTTSFSTPHSNCRGITVDTSGNLISADAATSSIYIHAGITSTITTSFALVPYALPNGVEITEAGNLISTDYFKNSIWIHAGITSTVTTSFSSPKNFPWGVTIRNPPTDASIDLSGGFIVKQWAEDLPAEFGVKQWQEDLPAEFVSRNAATVGPSSAAGNDPIMNPFQKAAFYAAGRRWVFYTDGTNLVFRSSTDAAAWTAATNVRVCTSGEQYSIHFDGTYVHYAYTPGVVNTPVYYRRGAPQSNGTITWSAVEQEAFQPGEVTNAYYEPSVSVDSDGYPWITARHLDAEGPAWNIIGIRSSELDGTFDPFDDAFVLEHGVEVTTRGMILPLGGNREMYCLWDDADNIIGKRFPGGTEAQTQWGADEDTGADVAAPGLFDAVTAPGKQVHLVWTANGTNILSHKERTYSTATWSAAHTIQGALLADMGAAISIGSEGVDPTLYVFWAPDENNPTADHVFYKTSTNHGVGWSAAVDWIDDSADTFPLPNQQSSFFVQGEFYIGCVWVRSSPDDVRYYEVERSMANGLEDLAAQFEVGQGSADLASKFNAAALNEELPAELVVRHAASQELLGELVVRHPGSEELLGEFIVRQAGSEELLAEFIVRHAGSEDLLGELVVRHPGSEELLGEFIVRQAGSEELLAEFIVRHSDSQDLLGELIVRHSASVNLLGELVVRHSGSEELLEELVVRHSAWADLKGSNDINVRHSDTADLAARFGVRQCYPYWSSRRLINGVVAAAEALMGDANLEIVIEGVMDDIKVWLDAECFEGTYGDWICIDLVPVAIKRATTYGVVAALYARYSKTFQGRVVPTVAPVTITVIGDDEKAMLHWMGKKRDMLELYLSAQGAARFWVSTADEEPVFTMDDIPATGADELESWHKWVEG